MDQCKLWELISRTEGNFRVLLRSSFWDIGGSQVHVLPRGFQQGIAGRLGPT